MHEFVKNKVFCRTSARFVICALGTSLFSVFSKVHQFVVRDQHLLSFSHWADHFLATFNKVQEFVQNSVLSPSWARFAFLHLAHHFLAFWAKFTSLYKTAFSARDQHVLSFSHWAYHFLAIFSKVQQFVQNSVVRTRSGCFVIFALGTLLFSVFSKVHEFVRKRRFLPEISTFCHFRTARTTL